MKLSYFIIVLGTSIIIIAFFVAIAFARKEKPQYYNYIFLFIVSGLLISINTISNDNNTWLLNKKISILIEQLLLVFQSLMLGLFFIEVLNKSFFLKKIKKFLILSIIFQITLLIVVLSTNTEIKPAISSNLFLLFLIFFYLKDLMNNKPTFKIVKSSTFWIVMGIFYSSCISLPVNLLIPFIPKTYEYRNLRFQIFSISNMSLIVLYIFIIKSYLCLKHPQNS